MEKEKVIKVIKEQVKFMIEKLNFNEVHIDSYTNSRGKTRYKGKIRVHDMVFTFKDLSLNEVDNIFDGIIVGYGLALRQIDYGKKK